MKKYQVYFVLSVIFPSVWALVMGLVTVTEDQGFLIYGLFAHIYLGVLQLMTGLYLVIRYKRYPDWAQSGILIYWLITGLYFAFCIWLIKVVVHPTPLVGLIFLGAPVLIAVYQFQLVYRLAGLRRRQLEQRAFLQLYNH